MIGHPVETAKGIGHAVTHPKELLNGLKEQYWESRKNWVQKVSGVTEAVCDILFLAYGAQKGFDKLSKGLKARKAAKIAESGETAGGKGEVRIERAGENGSGSIYKEVNIHGKINTEIGEVDLVNWIIYEDKFAGKFYMENADFSQTEQQWAFKQIYKKGSNRIDADTPIIRE